MSTISQMMINARLLLGEPSAQHPSDRALLQHTLNHCQSLFNQISNSNENWAVAANDLILTVQPGQEEYLLSGGPTMGKPFVMYTMMPNNPAHFERMIPTYSLQNLLLSNDGPRNALYLWPNYWDGSQHTALGVAFYERGGVDGWYCRVRPVPQISAQYRVIYGLGNWVQQAALSSSPVLSEHHHLLETRIALSLLPMARWTEDEEADRKTRAEYMATLGANNKQFTEDFQRYLRNTVESRITFRGSGFSYY